MSIRSTIMATARGPALAAIAASLWGCATPAPKSPYAVPAGVPTAKLIMRGSVPAGDLFGVFVYDDAETCRGARLAGAGGATRNPNTVPLAANGVPTTVEFMLVKANKQSCTLRWTFTPAAGKSYLVNGMAYGAGCRANLVDASDPDAMKAPADLVRRNVGGQACMNLAQARATSSGGAAGGQEQGAAVLQPSASSDDLKGLIGQ